MHFMCEHSSRFEKTNCIKLYYLQWQPQAQEMGLRRKLQGGPLCRIGFQAGMVVRELQSPSCRER